MPFSNSADGKENISPIRLLQRGRSQAAVTQFVHLTNVAAAACHNVQGEAADTTHSAR